VHVDKTDDQNNGHGTTLLLGFLAGTAIGAGLGLLFAPRAGADLRGMIGDSANNLRNAASERYRDAGTRMGAAVEDLAEQGRGIRGKVLDAVARGAKEGAQELERFATEAKARDPRAS
jgi:gas vesicle protein